MAVGTLSCNPRVYTLQLFRIEKSTDHFVYYKKVHSKTHLVTVRQKSPTIGKLKMPG